MGGSEFVGGDACYNFFADFDIEIDGVLVVVYNLLFRECLLYLFIIIIFHYKIICTGSSSRLSSYPINVLL